MQELIEANEKQKLDKELKLSEQAKQEEEEYSRIVDRQIKEREIERQKEEDRKNLRYNHSNEIR